MWSCKPRLLFLRRFYAEEAMTDLILLATGMLLLWWLKDERKLRREREQKLREIAECRAIQAVIEEMQ